MRGGRGAGDGVVRSTRGCFPCLGSSYLILGQLAGQCPSRLLSWFQNVEGENWHEMSLILITEDKCVSHSMSSHP